MGAKTRLERQRERIRNRRAAEQPEARQARLERRRECDRERITAEQREARRARLNNLHDCSCQRVSSLLIVLEDSWVQAKLTSFHADMANTFFGSIGMNRTSTIALPLPLSLEVPFFPIDPIFSHYSSCNESFPSIKLACIYSAACNHCSRDKREPKLYSAANSMNPGPVPPAL